MVNKNERINRITKLIRIKAEFDIGYYSERIAPLGLTEAYQVFPWRATDSHHYYEPDKSGNLRIYYPSGKDNALQSYVKPVRRRKEDPTKDEELRPIVRTRFRPGLELEDKDGKIQKYATPPGAPAPLFIPARTLAAIREGRKLQTLFVVEGELKAAAGDRHGLHIVGITGIHNFTSGGTLLEELEHAIRATVPDHVCLMFDSDLFDLSDHLEQDTDPTKRPRSFWAAARRFRERMQLMPASPDIWIAWPLPGEQKLGLDDLILREAGAAPMEIETLEADYWLATSFEQAHLDQRKKGIIDLREPVREIPPGRFILRGPDEMAEAGLATPMVARICAAMDWQIEKLFDDEEPRGRIERVDLDRALRFVLAGRRVARDLVQRIKGTGSRGRWFEAVKVTTTSDHQLRGLWALQSPETFYLRHKERLSSWASFRWNRDTYIIQGGTVELMDAEKMINLESRGGQLYSKEGNVRKLIGSFTFTSEWHLTGAREGYLLDTMSVAGQESRLLISSTELSSVQSFRAAMLRKGLFWEGSQSELMRAVALACCSVKHAESIDVLGWQPRGFWMWANGAYAGDWIEAADSGFVEVRGDHYFIPAASDLLADDEGLASARYVRHFPRRSPSLGKWLEMACSVYGVDRAVIGLAMVTASAMADVVRKERRFFPILFLFGPPQMGKSTYATSLQAFFGEPLPRVNMESGGTTVAGMQRVLSRTRNVPAFFDEFSMRTAPFLGDQLKNTFDGVSGTQGVKSGGNETRSYAVNATAIVAGQHLPSHDPALVSRCVLLEFGERPRPSLEEKQRMNDLQDHERQGLTHLVHQILDHRNLVENQFRITFLRIYRRLLELATIAEIAVTDRVIEIHAALVTPLAIIGKHAEGGQLIDEDSLVGIVAQLLPLHAEATEAVDEVEHFWTILDRAGRLGYLQANHEYALEMRGDTSVILIRFRRIHVIYKETCIRTGDKALPEATIRRYLKKHISYLGDEKTRVSPNPHAGPTSVMVFDSNKIDAKFWMN